MAVKGTRDELAPVHMPNHMKAWGGGEGGHPRKLCTTGLTGMP